MILGRIDLETQDGYLFQGYGTGNAITIDYDYDARGQLQRATSRVNNNTVSLPDRFYEVNYDNAANRSEDWRNVKDSAHRDAYTANTLNQYQSRGNHGYQNAIGFGGATWYYFQLTSPYSSTHNPTSPGSGSYFYSDIPRPGSSSVAEIVGAELKSVYGGSYGVQKLPYRRATETPQFDAAGNMTSDDLSTYIYDAEDRLIKITSAVGTTASKEIRYDYQHRRVEEKDYAGTTLVKWRRFVWSGWMLLAEVNVDVGTQAKTVAQTFTWGPDLSGSVHGVAGIGGLLLVDKSSTQQYVAGDDGRGNVTVLLDALSTGTPSNNLKAGVEYGPYGEVVRSTGDLTLLPFRFQTKWALGQSWQGSLALEHLDFGRRVYVPTFGRFLNRDPIGEEGGANLYHYCGNDPINGMDPLGLDDVPPPPKVYKDVLKDLAPPPWRYDGSMNMDGFIVDWYGRSWTDEGGVHHIEARKVYRWGTMISGDAIRPFLEKHDRSGKSIGPGDGGAGGGRRATAAPASPCRNAGSTGEGIARGDTPAEAFVLSLLVDSLGETALGLAGMVSNPGAVASAIVTQWQADYAAGGFWNGANRYNPTRGVAEAIYGVSTMAGEDELLGGVERASRGVISVGGMLLSVAGPAAGLARGEATTTLWRAVKPSELADILKTGQFRNLGSAAGGKYFSTTAEGAASYAKQAVKGFGDPPYTLVKTQVPNRMRPTVHTVDRNVPAVQIPDELLPHLKPEVLDYCPIPGN